ncbi:MAG: Maf family protein [Clostridia bacterium]
MPEIVLASQSPRRQELLKRAFFSFLTIPSDADETLPDAPPDVCVAEIARRKAMDVMPRVSPGALIISADTLVVCDGQILGKPRDEADARAMLTRLSGRTHEVYTGVVIAQSSNVLADYAMTRVKFRPLTSEQIDAYIHSGEPMDKAGAYGIQDKGAFLVERIDGDYFNVVGLPLCLLGNMLSKFGIDVLR